MDYASVSLQEVFRVAEVKGTDLVAYYTAPFYLWCNYHAPGAEQDSPSDYMALLAERGNAHERSYIEETHPDREEITIDTAQDVIAHMRAGVEAFDNLTIFDPELTYVGKPDLLERQRDGASALGPFYYVVKEIKSVSDPTTKRQYIMQAAYYNYLLGLLQGYTPSEFYIVNKAGEVFAFSYADYHGAVQKALGRIVAIKQNTIEITPTLDMPYPWSEYSKKHAWQARDISLVNGISANSKPKFVEKGLTTIDDLYHADIATMTEIKGIGETTAQQLKRSATALVEGEPVIFGSPDVPEVKTEFFFDLEATMPDDQLNISSHINYLFGLIKRKNDRSEFIPLVAESLDGEEEIFRQFLDIVLQEEDFVIYYYSPFEKQHLSRMFEEYPVDETTRQRIMDALVDLQKVVKQCVTFPTTKNGLKEIANYIGFQWRHADISAQESMAWYLDYVNHGDQEKLQKIIDYNEDDCEATRVIKDWLVAHA